MGNGNDDTIAAIATPTGRGALGVIRISGPDARQVCRAVCGSVPPPRHATFRSFFDGEGHLLDQGLVLYFPAPHSFTGEDVLELQTHGSPIVLGELLQTIFSNGARAAQPGEFSKRAFLNGKIDLLQAEAIADLINSASSRTARCAANSLQGAFSARTLSISDQIKSVRAHLEASIDFPDEGIDPRQAIPPRSDIEQLHDEILALCSTARQGLVLNHGIDVLIIGRPNVGKSTLLNALTRTDRAIVNSEPGTTRDILSCDLTINGMPVRIYDTAGIRNTDNAIEQQGVKRALAMIERCDLIIHLVDHQGAELLTDLVSAPLPAGVPIISVHNKIDLIARSASKQQDAGQWRVFLSASTGEGIDLLQEAIMSTAGLTVEQDTPFLARARHVAALQESAAALAEANLEDAITAPELVAEHLRRAQGALDSLVGAYTTEDLLGDIFARFCIGK